MRRAFCFVGLAFAAGCYGYYPEPEPSSLVGHQLLLTLTDSGSVVLARQLGPSIDAVAGRLTADSATKFMVAIAMVRRRDGIEADWRGEVVGIAHPLVAEVSERRFSRGRTTLFSAALGIALVAIREAFQGEGGGFGGTSPSGTVGGR